MQSKRILGDSFGWLSGVTFLGSDALWSSFQRGLEHFMNSYLGRVQAQTSKKIRPNWNKVKVASKGDDYEGFLCKEY